MRGLADLLARKHSAAARVVLPSAIAAGFFYTLATGGNALDDLKSYATGESSETGERCGPEGARCGAGRRVCGAGRGRAICRAARRRAGASRAPVALPRRVPYAARACPTRREAAAGPPGAAAAAPRPRGPVTRTGADPAFPRPPLSPSSPGAPAARPPIVNVQLVSSRR